VTLTNATGLPVATGISGLGTGVATALAVNIGSSGSPIVNGGSLGTPSGGTATNLTGLPLTTGITGTLPVANGGTGITSFGSGIATFLGTPSSANLAAALTDETGTGANVFATSPTLVTPILGTPQSATLTNATGLPLTTGVTGVLPIANGGTNSTATATSGGAAYGTGTAIAITAAGTSGQFLKSNGASAPSWAAISAGYTLGTPIDTTSGTAITFTGIPSGVKQVIVSFQQVSTSGTSYKWIRLGTSAGLQITSGYENNATRLTSGTAIAAINASGGFAIYSQAATDWLSGSVVLTLQNSSTNTWAAFGILGDNYNGNTYTVAGYVSLSGVLDRISFSANNGSDTFDQGQMNIAYI
jgi:hypothetical protein